MTTRPKSLREVAARSDSLGEFGRNLRDWLHELRRFSSRAEAAAAIAAEPPLLHGKFPEGRTADAWLGAYAEHLSRKLGRAAPAWAFAPRIENFLKRIGRFSEVITSWRSRSSQTAEANPPASGQTWPRQFASFASPAVDETTNS